jgi:hypothetical protein
MLLSLSIGTLSARRGTVDFAGAAKGGANDPGFIIRMGQSVRVVAV